MRIQSVRITNFRTLRDVAISFDTVTTFIGPNGTGKSTVLRALDWFFNGRPGSLTERDCSFGAVDQDIEVRVTFDELSERDRIELGKYAPATATTFTAWKVRKSDGTESLSANAKGYPDFVPIRAAAAAGEKRTLYGELRGRRPDLGLPTANSGTAVDQALTAWESEHTDDLVEAPENLQTNFFGFNSDGKMSGLFDFVLVTADLRASEEAVDGKASIIGRILERSVDRSAADEAIATIVSESRQRQQEAYSTAFEDQLEAMLMELNRVVDRYSPGRRISIAPSDVELKAPRTTFEVAIVDGVTATTVDRQGHGFQRTLLISALQVLAASGAASAEGVICLAIEEPELFQHPIQAQAFAKVLRALAEDPQQRIQITYATHSPYFVEAKYFNQIRRLVRSPEEGPVVSVFSSRLEEVQDRLAGVVSAEVVSRQLDTTTTGNLSAAIFASRVVLVEGTTEAAVLYGLRDRDAVGGLEASGVAVVPVGGKGNIPLAHAICTSLGIPTYAVLDGDRGYKARAVLRGSKLDQIQSEGLNHAALNRRLLKYFSLPETDFPETQVTDEVAILEDHLESLLASSWPEWISSCANVELASHTNLEKNQLAYRAATLEAEGTVPAVLSDILARAEGSPSAQGG